MVDISRRSGLGLLYTWTIIFLGFGYLWQVFPALNLDQGSTMAMLILLGVLAEWLAVPLAQGFLSGGYVIVLASQLICGGVTTAFVTALIFLIGLGIANRGNPLRATLFNSAQHVLAATGAATFFELTNGTVLPIMVYTLAYFLINHLLVYFYLLPGRRDYPDLFGWEVWRWDGLTYLITAPYGALLAMVYLKLGVGWALILFLPVLVAQIILRRYVHIATSNKELTALFQVSKGLRLSGEPAVFFNQILQETSRIVGYHTAVIFFWSDSRQLFLPGAAQGPLKEDLCNVVISATEGVVGQAISTKQPVSLEDVRDMLPEAAVPFQQFRSVLVIPLLFQGEVTGLLVLGEMKPYAFNDRAVPLLSIIGGQAGIVISHDLLEEKIQHLSATDRLTDFLTHRLFYRQAVKHMVRANSGETPVSLLLIDIDNLRSFNSRHGHGAGDGVIQLVAGVLRDITKPTDILGRYGGGELAVLAPGLDTTEALRLAEHIRIEVRDRRLVPEEARQQVTVTVSVGVATFPQDNSDPDQIFQGAEKAAARAKELGRDRTIAYSQLIKQLRARLGKDIG
ncbi:diguanylate cyclase with GAF sensor [Desulforamulus aeronauticus DSM 10349]|uniref:Diguanylate cyclase with GAF sensor n=1 Tax=Desulforamulus aeronauticus DSM 10349 TaxID=1121421 RepID=A0A1M6V7Q8_9FIRM|nr:diguanylate cyclase with GAF sensor [Desulforamulus aeronauticus DSM 10349]